MQRSFVTLLLFFLAPLALQGDDLKDVREQGLDMLRLVKKDVEKNYFDPAFGGTDMAKVWSQSEEKLKSAQTVGHTFGIIAQALATLNDSHTFFIPPRRTNKTRFGWRMTMVGDRCLVTGVKPGSDAEKQGLKPGDEVLGIEGYPPSRKTLWKMRYLYYTLQPRPSLRLAVRSPQGPVREFEAKAEIKTGKQILDLATDDADYYDMVREEQLEDQLDPHKMYTIGLDAVIYRMPDFSIDQRDLDNTLAKMRDYKSVILDLRGNQGGNVSTLEYMAGHLLGKDIVLATRKGRKEEKPIKSQANGKATIAAPLIVLVDSGSGSAAEILARAIQLEGRGKILGDVTSGSVRQSRHHNEKLGVDRVIPFGVSVTNADLLMKDGKSLEHVGVQPDELILPAAEDLAAQRDPVLARALTLLGIPTTPEAAGKMFTMKWRTS